MAKLIKKFLLTSLAIVACTLIAFIVLVSFAFDDMCGNQIFNQSNSPNNKYKVVVFQRDCGAMSGFSTQISVIPANENLENESGNIFVIKGHPETVAPLLHWKDSTTLVIEQTLNGSESFIKKSIELSELITIEYSGKQLTK